MGRGVSYPSYTVAKAYYTIPHIQDSWDWHDFVEDLKAKAMQMYPSLYECSEWVGREDKAVLKNAVAYFGVSEYCGIACVWIAERGDTDHPELATQWCNAVKNKFEREFGDITRIGGFSNGESVYERKGT